MLKKLTQEKKLLTKEMAKLYGGDCTEQCANDCGDEQIQKSTKPPGDACKGGLPI